MIHTSTGYLSRLGLDVVHIKALLCRAEIIKRVTDGSDVKAGGLERVESRSRMKKSICDRRRSRHIMVKNKQKKKVG